MLKRIAFKSLVVFAGLTILVLVSIILLAKTLPPSYKIASYTPPSATKVLDRNGKYMYSYFLEIREPATQREIPEFVANAFISVEDKRFNKHPGIDLLRTIKAVWEDVIHLKPYQGGSTITQQLARNIFLSQRREVIRKLKEIILAVKIERAFSKEEIITMYLNQIYFGSGIYGVKMAAQYFFDKDIRDINLREASVLAAIPKSPVLYSPTKHPRRNLKRANLILRLMLSNGFITEEEYEDALSQKVTIVAKQEFTQSNPAPYLISLIREYIVSRYGEEFLFRGGGTIYTTCDLDIQKKAQSVLDSMLTETEAERHIEPTKLQYEEDTTEKKSPSYLQGAIVSLDPITGGIIALVGGRDFKESEFNRVIQAERQPGSAFKPFVYLTAIDNGYYPIDKVLDIPVVVKGGKKDKEDWKPKNYDKRYLGEITLRKALALSRNLATVNLILQIGPDAVVMYARRMGINSFIPPFPSIALGSFSLTPLELTSAYAPFDNGGYRIKPYFIDKIVDKSGIVLESHTIRKIPVISPQTAYIMTNMLESVINHGTGINVRRKFKFKLPAAGKTGTTNQYRDNWFIGYTTNMLTGVWIGFDSVRTIYKGATGSSTALPIWAVFNKEVYDEHLMSSPDNFNVPEGIVFAEVCLQSGLLATQYCPATSVEPFRDGDEPTAFCNIHTGPSSSAGGFNDLELHYIEHTP